MAVLAAALPSAMVRLGGMRSEVSMKRIAGVVVSGVAIAALSGCGGGSSGGVASTPTPTTPTYSYKTIAEQTGSATYQTAGIAQTSTTGPLNPPATYSFGSGVTVAFNGTNNTYTLTAPNGATVTVGPSDIVLDDATKGITAFQKRTGAYDDVTLFGPKVNGVTLSYTVAGNWTHLESSTSNKNYAAGMIGGIPTYAGDMPRSGTASYSATVIGGGRYNNTPYDFSSANTGGTGNSTATFSANFGTGAISTSLNLVGMPPASGGLSIGTRFDRTFTGTGTIASGTNGFSGTFTGGSVTTSGFSGAFFGPAAKEFGYAFFLTGSDFTASGAVAGTK